MPSQVVGRGRGDTRRVYRIDLSGTVKRTLTVNTDLLLLSLAEEHARCPGDPIAVW